MEFIDLKAQYRAYQAELEEAALKVLRSGRYILGPEVAALEKALAARVGARYAVGVSSGTDALLLILTALGLGPGDAVIVPCFTFAATAEVVRRVGAQVVFADVDEKFMVLTPETVKIALSKAREQGLSVRALVAVGLFGAPSFLDELEVLAASEGLWLIEDACQSLGASLKGRAAGSFGKAAAVSFFPAKPLGAYGDAGMVFTSEEGLFEKIKALRVHGQTERYLHVYLGFNARLDTLQAALLLVKLKYFDQEIERRREIARRYREGLAGLPLRFQALPAGAESVYAQFVLCTKERDALRDFLAARGIPTAVYYPRPLHLQPAFSELGYEAGSFPAAEKLAQEILALPMHPFLEQEAQEFIIQTVRAFYDAG